MTDSSSKTSLPTLLPSSTPVQNTVLLNPFTLYDYAGIWGLILVCMILILGILYVRSRTRMRNYVDDIECKATMVDVYGVDSSEDTMDGINPINQNTKNKDTLLEKTSNFNQFDFIGYLSGRYTNKSPEKKIANKRNLSPNTRRMDVNNVNSAPSRDYDSKRVYSRSSHEIFVVRGGIDGRSGRGRGFYPGRSSFA